jgi:sigma-B regulation protein RsbU (phosphoserine phosphatase)
MVVGGGDTSDIVTLWVGRYDPAASELVWASGGHPPAALVRSDTATVEWLAPTGPLLGAIPDVVFGEQAVSVSAGDLVVLYTDGVTEARNGNIFFGEDRVRDTVLASGTPREVVRRLLTAVRRFGRGDLRDDVALLAIAVREVHGEESTIEEGPGD